jgi:hypothetical protein
MRKRLVLPVGANVALRTHIHGSAILANFANIGD